MSNTHEPSKSTIASEIEDQGKFLTNFYGLLDRLDTLADRIGGAVPTPGTASSPKSELSQATMLREVQGNGATMRAIYGRLEGITHRLQDYIG